MPPGIGRSNPYPGNGVNYYFNDANSSSSPQPVASTAPLPLKPVPTPQPRRIPAPVAKSPPPSVYFQTSYYYPAASRGTSYYDLNDAPDGRLTPMPATPALLTPPKPETARGR
jgi:hypothetical protein